MPGRRGPRALALDALVRVEEGAWSNLLLTSLLKRSDLDARDRALVTDFVYGTLRSQGTCDHLLGLVSKRPLARLDVPVRAALRLGAYQLLAGVAPHAAVGETVGALPKSAQRARPFVNAVLRHVADLGPSWPIPEGDDPASLAVRMSHPLWIVERLVDDLGRDDALATLESANHPPPVTLRANRLQTTPEDLAAELASGGISVEPGALLPGALLLSSPGDPGRLPAVAEGRATPQDQASQAVAAAMDARPGERVADVAAAPGGKATAMAEAMDDEGMVLASDLRPGRARRVLAAAQRLGLSSVQTVVADGRALPVHSDGFHRVLVDAPCSGLGVLRRRPEARWRLDPADVDRLAGLQRELLAAAAAATLPGGVLGYCVCTLTAEETLEIDRWLEKELPGFGALERPAAPWRPHGRGALLLPQDAGTDGMYLLRLKAPG
jgi:16S rRNA (cytosine967-C5)-methyltransferase